MLDEGPTFVEYDEQLTFWEYLELWGRAPPGPDERLDDACSDLWNKNHDRRISCSNTRVIIKNGVRIHEALQRKGRRRGQHIDDDTRHAILEDVKYMRVPDVARKYNMAAPGVYALIRRHEGKKTG